MRRLRNYISFVDGAGSLVISACYIGQSPLIDPPDATMNIKTFGCDQWENITTFAFNKPRYDTLCHDGRLICDYDRQFDNDELSLYKNNFEAFLLQYENGRFRLVPR